MHIRPVCLRVLLYNFSVSVTARSFVSFFPPHSVVSSRGWGGKKKRRRRSASFIVCQSGLVRLLRPFLPAQLHSYSVEQTTNSRLLLCKGAVYCCPSLAFDAGHWFSSALLPASSSADKFIQANFKAQLLYNSPGSSDCGPPHADDDWLYNIGWSNDRYHDPRG